MKERIIVGADGRKYITTEPQINKREWQGLTDEEISEVLGCDIHSEYSGWLKFTRAIEAALKVKNA